MDNIKQIQAREPDRYTDLCLHAPGEWENEKGPKDWWAVSGDNGIIAYFGEEGEALLFIQSLNLIVND